MQNPPFSSPNVLLDGKEYVEWQNPLLKGRIVVDVSDMNPNASRLKKRKIENNSNVNISKTKTPEKEFKRPEPVVRIKIEKQEDNNTTTPISNSMSLLTTPNLSSGWPLLVPSLFQQSTKNNDEEPLQFGFFFDSNNVQPNESVSS